MLAGAIPFGFAMMLLFSPPAGLGTLGLFCWMLGFAIAVRLLLTLFFVPHLSLGAEMVEDYHERTSLIGYRMFFSFAGGLATSIVAFTWFFKPTDDFPNGMLNAASYPGFGLFAGVLGMAAMCWSVVATGKYIPHLARPPRAQPARHALLGFITVIATLRQHAFRVLFSTTLMFMVLGGLTQTLLVYVATFLLGFEPRHLAFLASSAIVGIALASYVAQALSRRYDKKKTLAMRVFLAASIAFTPQLLYLAGLFQTLTLPARLGLVFAINGVSQAFFIAYIIIIDSMLTDTIDQHELRTGQCEEGLFFAARSLATKASSGIGSLVAGIALDVIEFPQTADPTNVSTDALRSLAIVAGPVSMLFFYLTIVVSSRYPLDEQRFSDIRRGIAAKKVDSSYA